MVPFFFSFSGGHMAGGGLWILIAFLGAGIIVFWP
jgi:hypothetical protein